MGPFLFHPYPCQAVRDQCDTRQAEQQSARRPIEEDGTHQDPADQCNAETEAGDVQADECETLYRTNGSFRSADRCSFVVRVIGTTVVRSWLACVPIEQEALIVQLATAGVAKFRVSLVYQLEEGCCLWGIAFVRVATFHELAVGLFDLLGRCRPRNTQHAVVVVAEGFRSVHGWLLPLLK